MAANSGRGSDPRSVTSSPGVAERSATIYDVAARAGVSPQTVSRVLRGFEGVRPATRAKVLKAAEKLDYKVNDAARALRTRRVNRIGALVHAVSSTGPGRTLEGAATTARRHGYVLDIVPMDGDDPASIAMAFALAAEHQIAGIVATARTDAVRATLAQQSSSVPVAILETTAPAGFDMSHDEAIGALAAEHLLALGHRDVAYVAGPPAWDAAVERDRGFASRVEALGGRVVWSRAGDWSPEAGYAAAEAMLAAGVRPTAVAAANDATAIGVIAALAAQGLNVPGDVSVMGVDDIPEARFHLPALTTIALDFEGEGAGLIEILLARTGELAGGAVTVPEPPRLVARSSTRALA